MVSVRITGTEFSKLGSEIKQYFGTWRIWTMIIPFIAFMSTYPLWAKIALTVIGTILWVLFARWQSVRGNGFGMGLIDASNLVIQCKVTKISWLFILLAVTVPISVFHFYPKNDAAGGLVVLFYILCILTGVLTLKTTVTKKD